MEKVPICVRGQGEMICNTFELRIFLEVGLNFQLVYM